MVKRTFSQGYRNFENKAGRVMKVASKALSIATTVASFLNVEEKNTDQVDSGDFAGGGIKTYLLNGISQGDTGNTRDGDQVKVMKTYGKIMLSNTDIDASHFFRIMLVVDRQADGTVPTVSELLDVGNSEPDMIAHNNMDNKFRFRVLKDKLVKLNPSGSTTTGDSRAIVSYFHNFIKNRKSKLKRNPMKEGLKTRYSGTGNTAADIASNSLWLFVIADGASAEFALDHVGRTRYVDN